MHFSFIRKTCVTRTSKHSFFYISRLRSLDALNTVTIWLPACEGASSVVAEIPRKGEAVFVLHSLL
jgi:hypothetical protein